MVFMLYAGTCGLRGSRSRLIRIRARRCTAWGWMLRTFLCVSRLADDGRSALSVRDVRIVDDFVPYPCSYLLPHVCGLLVIDASACAAYLRHTQVAVDRILFFPREFVRLAGRWFLRCLSGLGFVFHATGAPSEFVV